MIRLERAVAASPLLSHLLEGLPTLGLRDAWLVAGTVAATVWNQATGRGDGHGIADVDLAYFDPDDLDVAPERAAEARAAAHFDAVDLKFDVKNQARVHRWYEARFGRPIAPYRSVEEAVATYPTTATAIALRRDGGRLAVIAPFGLDDLFALTVRPNPRLVSAAVYRAKAARWLDRWPELTVLPWPSAAPEDRAS